MSDRIGTVRAVSFSPTGSTRRVLRSIAAGIGAARVQEDSLDRPAWREAGVQVGADELLLVGMPVYAGRVPGLFHGGLPVRGTGDAVCVVSYGNRAYEDALSELVGLTRRAGFRVIAAGAFAERADRRRASRRGRYGPYGSVRPAGRRQTARPGRMRGSDPGPGTRALQGLRSDSAGPGARSGALRALRPLRAGVSRADDRSGKLSRDRPLAVYHLFRLRALLPCRSEIAGRAREVRFRAENGSAPRGLPSEARARDISVTARSADGRGRFGRIAFPVPWAMGPRPEGRTAVRRVSACRRRSVCPLAVHGLCPAQPPFFVTNATAIPTDAGT